MLQASFAFLFGIAMVALAFVWPDRWPADNGPIYFETRLHLTELIKEPFNAASAGLFVFIVGNLWLKIRRAWRQHKFVAVALPILLVGGIGGTIYHALRMSQVFLVMDWLPIVILTLSASVYFFYQILPRWWFVPLLTIPMLGLTPLLFYLVQTGVLRIPVGAAVSINYGMVGVWVVTPIVLYLRKRNWANVGWLLASVGCLLAALFFRYADLAFEPPLVPVGTHFLWHIFGAASTYLIIELVIRLKPESHPVPPLFKYGKSRLQPIGTAHEIQQRPS